MLYNQIIRSIQNNNQQQFQKILNAGQKDLESENNFFYILGECIGKKRFLLARKLLEKIEDVNRSFGFSRRSPLSLLCEFGNTIRDRESYEKLVQLIKYLLERGANPDDTTYGNSVLSMAVTDPFDGSLRVLLEAGANPNLIVEKTTPLILAVQKRQKSKIQLLLQAGADPNQMVATRNRNKIRPLAPALHLKDKEMVEMLLLAGADPNLVVYQDAEIRLSALAFSIYKKNSLSVVKDLLENGANPLLQQVQQALKSNPETPQGVRQKIKQQALAQQRNKILFMSGQKTPSQESEEGAQRQKQAVRHVVRGMKFDPYRYLRQLLSSRT